MPAGKVTAIRAQLKDSQRVSLYIDDEFALGVSLTTLAQERIFVGLELDDAAWARLEAAEQADRATQAGARLIEFRMRSQRELSDRLRQKGFPPEAIAVALERLSRAGLLDDDAFSRLWVESRGNNALRGSRALRSELRRKGVAHEAIEAAMDQLGDADDERQRAESYARTILKRYQNESDRMRFMRRIGGALQRRGFHYESFSSLLPQLWHELQHGAPNDDESTHGEPWPDE